MLYALSRALLFAGLSCLSTLLFAVALDITEVVRPLIWSGLGATLLALTLNAARRR